MTSFNLFVYFLIIVSEVLGQYTSPSSNPPTCSNNNLEMTPLLRQKILDAMNNARQTVKNGQMLLSEGEYALPAAEMPDLVWNCEKEEEIHEFLQDYCEAYPFMNGNFPTQINMLDLSWNHFGLDVSDYDTFIQDGISINPTFNMFQPYFMARSPIFTGSFRLDVYYSKAETLACAMYDCDVGNKVGNGYPANFTTQIMCIVDPKVQFGEELYEVASSATDYIPPTEDVICRDSFLMIEHREMFMKKINEIRSKIAEGSYVLENGNTALKALNMSNLIWSCDEEAAIGASLFSPSCDDILYNHETEFQKFAHHQPTTWMHPNIFKGYVNDLINEFFVSNPNFNFLSSSSTYSTEYPAALALSDQAEIFACGVKYCYKNCDTAPGSGLHETRFCKTKRNETK